MFHKNRSLTFWCCGYLVQSWVIKTTLKNWQLADWQAASFSAIALPPSTTVFGGHCKHVYRMTAYFHIRVSKLFLLFSSPYIYIYISSFLLLLFVFFWRAALRSGALLCTTCQDVQRQLNHILNSNGPNLGRVKQAARECHTHSVYIHV